MDIKMQVQTNNGLEEIEGKLINVLDADEKWAEYKLEDGTIIKIKNVLVKIIDMNTRNPDGTKVYATQFQPVFNVIEQNK